MTRPVSANQGLRSILQTSQSCWGCRLSPLTWHGDTPGCKNQSHQRTVNDCDVWKIQEISDKTNVKRTASVLSESRAGDTMMFELSDKHIISGW